MNNRHAHWADRLMFGEPPVVFLRWAIALVLGSSAAFLVILFMVAPEQVRTARGGGPVVLLLLASAAWVLLWLGRIIASTFVLGIGLWAYITGISLLLGGSNSMLIIAYPVIITLAGWLLGPRVAVAVAALTAATCFGFLQAELRGLLPPRPPTSPALLWIVQATVFAFSALLISYVVRSYRNRLAEVRKLGGDLALRSAEVQAREADLNRAQAVAHVGSWVYDIAGGVIRLSAETCRIFGLPEGTLGSRNSLLARVQAEDRAAVDAAWQALLDGSGALDIEHRIRADATIRWVRHRAELEFGADGKPLRAVGTTQDISERKRAEARHDQLEAQLRESQKMEALGTLAGGVAHDFNNIVATIMGNAELARRDVGPRHAALESLEEICKASERAKELVQQILAFGRRQVLERSVISLAPVLQESARLLRRTLPAGVGLSLECAPEAPAVMADATQVEQVLLNLCSNAWQAVQGQPRAAAIEVSLTLHVADGAAYAGPERRSRGGRVALQPGRYACLTVRDNGTGMDEATVAHIFEPFFTTKPMGKGTGLGLAVVHGVLQDHGASIDVDSVPGEGTAFRVYFPEAQAPLPAAVAHAAVGAPAPGQGRHVLYVDDDEAIVFLMTRLLERQGYRVSGYTDPREALAAVRAQPQAFDLIVTDYNMPAMSGLELAHALHRIRADLPLALASGYITEQLRAEAPAAGVSELIYKPNTVDELCRVVARLANSLPV